MFIGEDREPPRLETFTRVKSRAVHLLKLLHRILILSNPILILVCCDFGSDSKLTRSDWPRKGRELIRVPRGQGVAQG